MLYDGISSLSNHNSEAQNRNRNASIVRKKTLDNRYNRMHVSIFMSNFLFGYNM